ncbi:MAG: hypothetical protein ACRDG5_01865, partial [Anaerolineales bacterium]
MRRSLLIAGLLGVLLLADIFVRGLALARATPDAPPTLSAKAPTVTAVPATSTPSPIVSGTPAATGTPSETSTVTPV